MSKPAHRYLFGPLLGAELRRAREARELSLSTAAGLAGISAGSHLRDLENDASAIGVATLYKLCDTYRVDVRDVLRAAENRIWSTAAPGGEG